jgi:transglutaminase-like putative cysteine protease
MRTALLLTTVFLSLMLLSEAINYAPRVPTILHISDHSENEADPDSDVTPGSMISIETGKNPGKENLFEILGTPKTSYIRQNALEVYEEGYWFPFNVVTKTYDHRPIEHFKWGFTGKFSSFYVNPLFPMTGFIPSVIYTSEIGGSEQLILYPNQLAFYSKTSVGPYPIRNYERLTQSYLLENSRLLTTGRYIEIPVNIYEKLRPLALSITEGYTGDYSKLQAIELYLSSHYTYDLNYNSPPEGRDPVEWFLFADMKGVCWHFNSAFVLLARSIGLPARLVIGYLVKPDVEYQIVKADQYHAWVEAEFEGYGWITFDASPGQIQDIENSGTIPTNTTITSQDTVCLKGKAFNVEGKVTAPNGLVNNVKAIAYMKQRKTSEAIPVGFTQVVNGSYVITCMAPRYLNTGNYQIEVNTVTNKIYIGSSSDPPIKLKAETFFNVSLPPMVIVDRPFNIEGVLQETETSTIVSNFFYYLEADEPTLVNASVIGDETQPMLVRLLEADEANSIGAPSLSDLAVTPGQKALTRNIQEIHVGPAGKINIYRGGLPSGNYSYTLRWNGTEYLLPASNNKVIRAVPLTVTPETPENIFRSETTQITGTIHAMNLTGDHELIHIIKDGAPVGSVTSDYRGVFKLPLTIPKDHPLGPVTIEYTLDRNNYSAVKDATIYARTRLSTLPQDLGYWYAPFNITGRLTNDFNESMPGIDLTLSYFEGGALTNWTVATDESGFAVFPINLISSPSSDRLHFNLTSQKYGFYFPARLEGDISFVPAVDYVGQSLQMMLPVALISALIYFSKILKNARGFNTSQNLTSKASVSVVEESPPIQIDEPNLGFIKLVENDLSIDVEAPQIKPPYPAVWGLNDPLTLKITLKAKGGKNTPHANLKIVDGEESFSFEASDRGEFEITKSYGDLDVKEVKFHYSDEKREAETVFRVRIVEYKYEIIRLLNEYLEKIRDEIDFDDRNTVREIVEEIKLRTPESRHRDLETIVRVFEEAEYSLHPIDRADYELFYSSETRSLEATQI